MKLGCLPTQFSKKEGFEVFAEFVAEIGLEVVDIPEPTAEIKTICDRLGLAIGSSDISAQVLVEDDDKRAQEIQKAKDEISAIADIGGKVLFIVPIVRPPELGRAKGFELFQRAYPALVSHAEDKGIKIAMEPWPGPPPHLPTLGCTPETLRAMFEEIPSPALGICYDPSHYARLQVDYLRLLAEFGSRVNHVHLKDTEVLEEGLYEYGILGKTLGPPTHSHSQGFWRYCIPGKGLVDWDKVINRLRDIGYGGALSFELEDNYYRETTEDQKRGIRVAKKFMDGVLDRG